MNLEIPYDIKELALDAFVTGSRVICNPPVTDTDLDVAVLVDAGTEPVEFIDLGYTLSNEVMAQVCKAPRNFSAFRRGEVNLVVTSDPVLFERYKLATEWATKLNLKSKRDRAQFFELVKFAPDNGPDLQLPFLSPFPFPFV